MYVSRLIAACLIIIFGLGTIRGAAAQSGFLPMQNDGPVPITQLLVSPFAKSFGWGSSIVGPSGLMPGQIVNAPLPQKRCLYDVRVTYANGYVNEALSVNICGIPGLG